MSEEYFIIEKDILDKAREVFGKSVDDIYPKLLKADKEKFLRIIFFYYWRCYKIRQKVNELDEGIMLTIVTSSIEALMSDKKHKTILSWFDLECRDKTLPFKELLSQYSSEYGTTRKFVKFWKNYVIEKDKKDLEENSYYFDKEYKKCILSIEDISKLLYSLRSSFVHDANCVPLANDREPSKNRIFLGSDFTYEDVHYFLGTTMDKLANIFEKGFIDYFTKKTDKPA